MKTAIITGGTRGIGAGLVRDFLKLGWNVSYSGTSDSSVGKSMSLLSANYRTESFRAFKCDVTVEKDLISLWDNTIKSFGKVDIWVNNAGTASEQVAFHKIPAEVLMKIIDTNIKGLMLATQIAYNRMDGQGFGAIYNMEGLGSDGRTIPGLFPYDTSKRLAKEGNEKILYQFKNFKISKEEISSHPDKYVMIVRPSMQKDLERISGIDGGNSDIFNVGRISEKT